MHVALKYFGYRDNQFVSFPISNLVEYLIIDENTGIAQYMLGREVCKMGSKADCIYINGVMHACRKCGTMNNVPSFELLSSDFLTLVSYKNRYFKHYLTVIIYETYIFKDNLVIDAIIRNGRGIMFVIPLTDTSEKLFQHRELQEISKSEYNKLRRTMLFR